MWAVSPETLERHNLRFFRRKKRHNYAEKKRELVNAVRSMQVPRSRAHL